MALPMHPSSLNTKASTLNAKFAPVHVQPSYQPSAPPLIPDQYHQASAHTAQPHIMNEAVEDTPKEFSRLPSIPPRAASPPLRQYSQMISPEAGPSLSGFIPGSVQDSKKEKKSSRQMSGESIYSKEQRAALRDAINHGSF
jgi:hypothetical protein